MNKTEISGKLGNERIQGSYIISIDQSKAVLIHYNHTLSYHTVKHFRQSFQYTYTPYSTVITAIYEKSNPF